MNVKQKILIADDSEINRALLMEILGDGYEYLEAENGVRAVALLREHTDIALVLLDINMPVMDGFTLMKQLKMENKYAHIPIIVTSQGGDKSVEKSFALGATDFVEKPYNPRIIMHRVQNVVMAYKNARSEAAATNEKNDSVS